MIKLEKIGSVSDIDNEFLRKNGLFCNEWKQFIVGKSGKLVGKYSEWALKLLLKYNYGIKFNAEIEKSNVSHGNLFVTNRVERSVVRFSNLRFKSKHFEIRSSSALDKFLILFNKKYSGIGKFVLIKSNDSSYIDSQEIEDLVNCLNRIDGLKKFKLNSSKGNLNFATNTLFRNFDIIKEIEHLFG